MLNKDVNVCNVCRCTQYGNKPANTNSDNQCNREACDEAIENYNKNTDDTVSD